MADPNDRTFSPSQAEANRTRMQGGGVGAREMDAQRDPDRLQRAASPEPRSFAADLDGATNGDRPSEADFGDSDIAAAGETADESGASGDLGVGTPPNVDIHKLGQADDPEADWGEAAGEGATFSSDRANRGDRAELDRSQGAKTRTANKDIISRGL